MNKEPDDLDKLIAKGYTLFHNEPIDTTVLLDETVRCLVSIKERVLMGNLEFHCVSELDRRFISE